MIKRGLVSVAIGLSLFTANAYVPSAYAQGAFQNKINKVFFSEWIQFSSQTNDGRKVNQAQVPADDPVIDSDGTKRKLIFAVECRGKESTAAFILQGSELKIDSESTVIQLKGDRDEVQEVVFHPTANKKALIIRDNAAAINFVQSLYDKTRLHMKAGLSSPATINVEFDINRIETAVEPIAKACKWPVKE